MRRVLATILIPSIALISIPAALSAAEPATFRDVKVIKQEGDKSKEMDAVLAIGQDHVLVTSKKGAPVYATIPYPRISKMVYEKSAHPRWKTAAFITVFALFSKGKKHWLTIQYRLADPPAGQTQPAQNIPEDFVMLHLDKGNYQMIIALCDNVIETAVSLELV